MARIIPFRGLRYNQEKIANLSSVVTPPYDIIDETAQARYYAESPVNIIRLELGFTFPQDTIENNRYTRAAKYLEKWLQDEILIPEPKPSFYVYRQEFLNRGKKLIRTGLICGLAVEPYEKGTVLPHEETLSKPKADRLQLMRATQSNFSSIFGLYVDEKRTVDSLINDFVNDAPPVINITDENNEVHKIWVVDDDEIIGQVISLLSPTKIFIADGHHRYETALEYAREMKEAKQEGFDYVMATLVNLYDEGLVVLPTHRLVSNLPNFDSDTFKEKLEALFVLETADNKNDLKDYINQLENRRKNGHVFGMYLDGTLYFLTLKNLESIKQQLPQGRSDAWKELDVAILDNIILDGLLGIGTEQRANQENLAYSRSEEWVVKQVDSRQFQIGFFLNSTRVEEIVDVAESRDKMPQKSTYFYPKLITGLIINNLKINP